MSFSIIYITFPDETTARDICGDLVRDRYAACANVFPMQSVYWWLGTVEQANEWVGILKTTNDQWPHLEKQAEKLHPYEIPCITRWSASANASYEAWIKKEVAQQPG